MNKILLLSLAVVFSAVGTQSLSCARTCSPCASVEELECKGGLVPDACACCNVCAKVAGEECGGPFDLKGRCDQGLRCDIADPHDFNAHGECVEIEEETIPPFLY